MTRRIVGGGRPTVLSGFGKVVNPELVFLTLTEMLLIFPLCVVRTVDVVFLMVMSFFRCSKCSAFAFWGDEFGVDDIEEHDDNVFDAESSSASLLTLLKVQNNWYQYNI